MNMKLRYLGLSLVLAVLAAGGRVNADSGTTPDFKEVESLLLEHMAGATKAELNQAAVKGLLAQLKGKVTLISDEEAANTNATVLVATERQFDGGVGYIRVKDVEPGLAEAVSKAASQLTVSNKLIGLVLDLRYADGADYDAAAATVDLFLSHEVPLLNAGKGLIQSKEKENALKYPVIALVNGRTIAAAEALGAMLRQAGVGLLIGESTAGRAGITTDYTLTTGQTLRVVTAPVQLGDAKAIPSTGVQPDVEVAVAAADAMKYYNDPFASLGRNGSAASGNGGADAARVRVTEADLVREKRGDGDLETLAGARTKSEDHMPKVNDPALARAIDLLKGLAVVRQWKF